jgi:hypothetical protein
MRSAMRVAVNANNAEIPCGDLGCCTKKVRKLLESVMPYVCALWPV